MRQSLERALSGLTSDVSTDAGYEGSGYDAGGYGRRYSFGARPSSDFSQGRHDMMPGVEAGRRSATSANAAAYRAGSFERRSSFHSSHRCAHALLMTSTSSCVDAASQTNECLWPLSSRLGSLPVPLCCVAMS